MKPLWVALTLVCAAGASALLGGVFFAFSNLIMRSLAKAQSSGGAEAMQLINREVMHTLFGALLWVMLAVALALATAAVMGLPRAPRGLIIAGGLSYAVGVGLVSGVVNVPLNVQLDGMDLRATATVAFFNTRYVPTWTLWNHARTIACLITAACYLWAAAMLATPTLREMP